MLSAPEQAAPQPSTPPMSHQGEPLGLHLPTNRAAVAQVFRALANGKTGEGKWIRNFGPLSVSKILSAKREPVQ
jgi:hypothetical protein